jgi:superfamily II DNA/RNA helicase
MITLHSQLSKDERLKNYEAFRDSQELIMLSTDLGARGLHFPNLDRVINYDFPLSTTDYLQRAGRTGRAVLIFLFLGTKRISYYNLSKKGLANNIVIERCLF